MADVLLVFVRDDEQHAEGIAESLERSGLSVARGGNVFDVSEESPCVLVVWSSTSARSAIVRDVAIRAQREGKLVAVRLGGCETPLGFSRPAPHDLGGWRGDPDDPILDPMFFAADRLVCAARLGARGPEPTPEPPAAPPRRSLANDPPPARSYREEPASAPEAPPAIRVAGNYVPVGGRRATAAAAQPAPAPARSPPQPLQSATPAPAERLPPNVTEEALAWKRIEHSTDPKDFLDYLSQYSPHGIFCELAQVRIDKLMGGKARPPVGAFIPHNPSPHQIKEKPRLAPRPARPETPAPVEPEPVRHEPPPAAAVRREAPRAYEPHPPSAAASPPPQHQEWSEYDEAEFVRRPPARTATGRPRRRAEPMVRAPDRADSGLPWRPLLILALLGAGGVAFVQTLPKQTPAGVENPAAPTFPDAPRAGPIEPLGMDGQQAEAPAAEPVRAAPLEPPAPRTVAPSPRPQTATLTPPRQAGQREAGAAPYRPPVTYTPPVEQQSMPAPAPAAPPPALQPPGPSAGATPAPPAAAKPSVTPSTMAPAPAATGFVSAAWLRRPSDSRMESLYPPRALAKNVSGGALLNCAIGFDGKLSCLVEQESPAGFGFGVAAIRAASFFVAQPTSADGVEAYGKRTRVRISFAAR